MADLTLAATDNAIHDQALAANTVQRVTVTPRAGSVSNLVRLFNRGSVPLYWRRNATTDATVQGSGSFLLEPGASTDLRIEDLNTAPISMIAASAGSFTLQRRSAVDAYRAASGQGGSGGGGSTDVSALNKETTQGNVLTALGSSGQLHGDLGQIYARLANLALDSTAGSIHTDLTTGVAHTDSAAILAKLVASPALDATVQAVRDSLNTGTAHTDSAAILAKLIATPATAAGQGTLKAAATAAVAADPSIVMALSPNSPLPAGLIATLLGSVGAAAAVETGNLTAAAQAAGGTTDLAGFGQAQVQVTGTWVGTLTFQVSNDQSNWVTKTLLQSSGGLANVGTTSANGLWSGHIGARYFRVLMSAFTSGTAVVTTRYNSAPSGVMPTSFASTLRATASADAQTNSAIDEVAIGGLNSGGGIDRARVGAGIISGAYSVGVATGLVPLSSIAAATAAATGTALDGATVRSQHVIQVDVTTTTAGTAGSHTVLLEGSLDNVTYTALATVNAAATSTTATDASNHAVAVVTGQPWRYVRARSTAVPTTWVGSVTARVASV